MAAQLKQEKQQRRLDALNRIPIEGKFGQGKNGYGLSYIRAKTQKTSGALINSIFLVMNLMVLLRFRRFCCVQLAGMVKMYLSRLIRSFFDEVLPKVLYQFINREEKRESFRQATATIIQLMQILKQYPQLGRLVEEKEPGYIELIISFGHYAL